MKTTYHPYQAADSHLAVARDRYRRAAHMRERAPCNVTWNAYRHAADVYSREMRRLALEIHNHTTVTAA